MSRRNLFRRYQTWYVRVGVNKKHRDIVGRAEYVRSTGTRDAARAERLKHGIIDNIHKEIDQKVAEHEATAEKLEADDPASVVWLNSQIKAIRQSVKDGLEPEMADTLIGVVRDRHLAALGKEPYGPSGDDPGVLGNTRTGRPPRRLPVATSEQAEYLASASKYATDLHYKPLSEAIEQYLTEVKGNIVPSTYNSKKRMLDDFQDWLGGDPSPAEVTRRHAGRYISEVIVGNGKSEGTNRYRISVLHGFWAWCIRKEFYPHDIANPWHGHGEDLKGSRRGGNGKKSYRAWTEAELKVALSSLKGNLRNAAVIAMYTGMRLNEITHVEVSEVILEDNFIGLPEGKTDNSVRQVPLHPVIRPLVEKLCSESADGYLLSGLKATGENQKRGKTLGNRFSEWKVKTFPDAGRVLAFHGFRSTFTTACETAGLEAHTIQRLVGHAPQNLTFGVYSKGPGLDRLLEAVEKVELGVIDKMDFRFD